MKTLTVPINETDFLRLGLKTTKIPYSDLKEKISLEYAKAALRKCHKSAKKAGLSNMTMDEINAEVQAVRDACKKL